MVTSGSLAAPLSPACLCFDSSPGALKTPGSPGFTFQFTLFQKLSLDPIQVLCPSMSQLLWPGRGFPDWPGLGHVATPGASKRGWLDQVDQDQERGIGAGQVGGRTVRDWSLYLFLPPW